MWLFVWKNVEKLLNLVQKMKIQRMEIELNKVLIYSILHKNEIINHHYRRLYYWFSFPIAYCACTIINWLKAATKKYIILILSVKHNMICTFNFNHMHYLNFFSFRFWKFSSLTYLQEVSYFSTTKKWPFYKLWQHMPLCGPYQTQWSKSSSARKSKWTTKSLWEWWLWGHLWSLR